MTILRLSDTLTYTVNRNPQNNWLSFDTPTFTFSGTPKTVTDIGINTITVTATDLNGGSVNSSFTVTVDNRIPMVDEGLASTSVFVGDQFSYKIPENAFSDDDIAFDDALTYTANINPNPPDNWLSFDTPMFTVSGTPTSTDDIGINTITVTATDLNGGSVDSSFTVTVGNRIPAVNEGLRSTIVFVGDQFSYEIPENAFSDDDIAFDDTLTYTANINPNPPDNWLSFDTPMFTFSGTPTSTDDIGITTITVTATDLNGGSVDSSFTLTVFNKPPIQIEDLTTQVAVFGKMFSYRIPLGAFIDPDNPDGGSESLSYSTDQNLGWLNFNIDTFSGIPTSETSTTGINTVSFTVTSLNGSTLDSAFILNIVESNKPPIQSTPLEDITVLFDVLFSYTIPETVFSDPDGGSLSYTTNEHPSADWLNFNTETRTFFGTPDLSNLGDKTSITVTAADNNGGIIKDVFIITVEASTAAFITTWIILPTESQITIPTFGLGYDYRVNWGDGDTTAHKGAAQHTYDLSEGTRTYTVTLIGDFPRIHFSNSVDRDKIISIDQWGTNPWSSMNNAFRRCSNLRYNAIDNPDLSRVTDMSGMFNQATVFNGNIGGWDVSKVTTMRLMFLSASEFNQNIGSWNVSNVINMRGMFFEASAFNQNIGNWIVSNVTDMREMFSGTSEFNQNIGSWKVGKVTDMLGMFFGALAFDQDIGRWDVSKVENMQGMFSGALAFDQDIGDWDVSSVTRPGMSRMFEGATLSTDNYDALLAGWSTIDDDESRLQSRIMFHAGSSQYCNQAARDILTETYIWDIGDDGPLNDDIACEVPTVSRANLDQVATVDMEFSYTIIPEDTFSDPTDGDTLTYTVSAYPPTNWLTIDTAGLAFFGTPSVGDIGVITITVIATDNFGSTVEDIFTITVIAPFITTWQVDAGERITIPTTTGNTYSYHVDWGDDSIDTMTYNADAEHTYTTTGSYTVSITGDFPGIFFNNGGDKDKIISIDQWGINTWRSMDSAFEGCTNLRYNAVDNPHFSNVSSMKEMFKGAIKIDGNFGDWNVSNISDMTEMFNGVTLSTANYDDLLLGWGTLDESETSLQSRVDFDAGNSQYCSQSRARFRLTSNPNSWNITDGGQTYNCSSVTIDVPSDSSLIPDDPDITNGSVFRLLFVTRQRTNFSGILNVLDYNVFVQRHVPNDSPLATFRDQFYALISGNSVDANSVDARDNTFTNPGNSNHTDALIYWLNGDKVADNYDHLYDGDWDSVNAKYQDGEDVILSRFFRVLTNTSTDGTKSDQSLGILDGDLGSALISGFTAIVDDDYPLYALSPLIKIVNMPPILVNPIPDQITPFINTDSFSYTFLVNTFNDPDGEPESLSYSTDENLDWLTFSSGTRTFSGTPSTVTHIGISTITVTATDLSGDSTNSIFTLTVPNRPPEKTDLIPQVAFSQKMFFYQIPEDAFSDPDGGTLLYSTNETPGWINFSTGNRTFTGRPSLSDIGITTITVTATDLNNGSVDSSFTLTVFNSPPIQIEDLTTQVAVVGKGFSYIIPKGAFIDPDDGSLSYDYTPDESQQWLNFSTGNRTFSGTPTNTDPTGITSVVFTVTDPNGGSVNSHFILNVVEFNTPPTLNQALQNQRRYVNQTLNYPIDEPENAFIDPDGGSLLYSTDKNLGWLMFSSKTRTFSGTPTSTDDIGISTITVTATDLNGGSVNSSFTVTVVNRIPAVNEGLASTIVFVGAEFSYEIPENAFSDGDIAFGDTLTYTANINPQDNWLNFDTPTLTFSGTPTSTDIGITTITVTATDLNGGSVNSSFTLTVFNSPPIQIEDLTTQVAVVGKMFSYRIPLGAFIDPDNPDGGSESLSYSTDENPVWLSFSTGTRTFLGIPTSENSTTGINTVPFTVTDLNGGSVNSYFILNVVEFNTTPTLNQPLENQMTYVNRALHYPIDEPENAFIDPDGGSLLYSTDKNPGWLMFSSKTRTFSGTPTSTDDIGISTITVTATDLNGGSVNSSFTLTVPNRPPIQTANLTTTVAVVGKMFSYRIPLGAFIDPDGGSLSYAYTPDEDQIRLSFSSGTRTFSGTPTSTDPIGISTVPFTVTDPNGGSLNSDFVLRITAENRPPTLNQKLQNQRTYVNQVLNYPIDEPENAFIDPDGGSLLYSAKGNPNWFEFSSESRTFSGTPSTITDIGITTITVIAADLNGGSTSDTFTVAVVNRVPAVNEGLASTSVFVGAEFSYEIPGNAFSDGDIEFGDTLTYTANINSQSTWLSFDTPTLTFSGRPTSTDDIGISTITVTATDLNGGSVNNSFTVTVDNRIPTVNAGFASTSVFVGAEFSYEIPENAFSDDDIMYNDTLTYTANINSQSTWLSFDTPTLTFSSTTPPNLSDIGISTITVTATDRNGGSVNSSFTVTVDNRIPTVNAGLASTSVFVGADFSYEIPGNAFRDDDIMYDDTLTYTANINPQGNWLTFASETRIFTGRPSLNDIGISTITVTATDRNSGSVNSSFTATVINRIPAVNEGLASTIVFVGAEFSYEIEDAFIDPDGGSLLYSTDENLDWLMFSSKTRTFFGTPSTVTDIGISTITVTATDLNDGSVNSSFTVTVVNRVPTVTAGLASTSVFVGADFSYKILENAFRDDDIMYGDTLTYTANINPQGNWLTFASETRTFTGRPSLSDIGISTITVTATDRNGGSVNSSFTATVINRIPAVNAGFESTSVFVGADFSYKIPENAFSDGDITFNDTLTYTANINPQGNWLTFASETRTFTGRPSLSDIGISTITVTATDRNGGSVNSSFTVTVDQPNPDSQCRSCINKRVCRCRILL